MYVIASFKINKNNYSRINKSEFVPYTQNVFLNLLFESIFELSYELV